MTLLACHATFAHESRPAFLEITQVPGGKFEILWKVPSSGGSRPDLSPVYPEHCSRLPPYQVFNTAASFVEKSRLNCTGKGLYDSKITIAGLSVAITDVLLRISTLDGGSVSVVLHASRPTYEVPAQLSKSDMIASYFRLGAQHILSGADHLIFVTGLLLLVRGLGPLLITISSFTLAHSLTLGLAAFGLVPTNTSLVESLIALSIVFLALEIHRRKTGKVLQSRRRPYLLALFFGLLHGMGFAGALLDIGLPVKDSIIALLFFNLGVEAGQLLFVALILSLYGLILKLRFSIPTFSRAAASYVIGTTGAFWLFQRLIIPG